MSGPAGATLRPPRGRWVALLVVLGLVASACTAGEPADPEEVLVDTVQQTFDEPFAYRLVAEADRDALAELGDELGSVAARLNLFEVTGVVHGEVATVDVALFSTTPLLQVRRFGDEQLYLRVALSEGPLASVDTPELEGRLLGLALQTGQPDSVTAAIEALFDDDWIGVAGAFEPGELLGGGAEPEPDDDGLATPLPEVVADYVVVRDQVDEQGRTTFRVDLQVRELLRALASLGGGPDVAGVGEDDFEQGLGLLPEVVTGDVVADDGRVREVVFDVAAAAREEGVEIPGSLQLRLELSDHGDPSVPPEPEATVVVPSGELAAGLSALLSTGGDATPTSEPSPDAP